MRVDRGSGGSEKKGERVVVVRRSLRERGEGNRDGVMATGGMAVGGSSGCRRKKWRKREKRRRKGVFRQGEESERCGGRGSERREMEGGVVCGATLGGK
ncbi:hypothetical protein HAX54_025160 [Datura stramonium]|uniref:Uncharacterized protein n=1 Tax=Datura stramonium TaxID=4076 RepID=A0ABS8V1D0_DATST|nr:hypothetical protein [Datura stramonium]